MSDERIKLRKYDKGGIPMDMDVEHDYMLDSAFSNALNQIGRESFIELMNVLGEDRGFQEKMGKGDRKYVGMETYVFGNLGGEYVCKGPFKINEGEDFDKLMDLDLDLDPYDTLGSILSEGKLEGGYGTSLKEVAGYMGPEKALGVFKPLDEKLFGSLVPAVSGVTKEKYGMENGRVLVRFVCYNGQPENVETISIMDSPSMGHPISCMKY